RRRHDSSGSGHSAFEPLVANGAPASLIPKPGSLKRGLVSHCPDDGSSKRSRTSSVSSLNNTYAGGIPSSIRNAIASSYSSSRGLAQVGDAPPSPWLCLASWVTWRGVWRDKPTGTRKTPLPVPGATPDLSPSVVVETPVQKKQNSLSPPSGSSGKRKRKIQLLSSGRGDQLALPPPPQLGYAVTSEDLDAEKKAALQWFNKVLEDKAGKGRLGTQRGRNAGLGLTGQEVRELLVWSCLCPGFGDGLSAFGLRRPTATAAAPTTNTAAPTTAPVFKPIFGALPKSESAAACTAVVSPTVTVSVSSGPSTSSTTTMFKPIFGSVTAAASSPAKASPFAFKPPSQPASTAELSAASTATVAGFTGLPNVIFTTAATTATTQSSSTDATIKPVFSFGLNPPASTGPVAGPAVTAATSTTTSQPFLFGGSASSAPNTETTFATPGPVFQFGKPLSATVTATTSVPGGPAFGQAPSNSAAPTTTVGFSLFGSTTLTSSTPTTMGQATLTFGSSLSAFGSSFSTGAKPPPPYPGAASQPAFSTGAAESQPPASKPAAGPVSFGSPFSFGAPTAQPAAQPAFGSSAQPTFGTTSAQGSFSTPSTQAAFGTTTSVFSFGTATSTTTSFGSATQTTSSSTGTTVFGTTPSPFTFGAAAQPGPSGSTFGIGTPAPSSGSPAVGFSFGAGQSGAAPAATPFGSSLAQNQSTPFAFAVPSTPDNKPVFRGAPAPTFGQSAPVPGAVGGGGSGLSFVTPSTPASAFGGVSASFGSSTPTFSIGTGSKTGARQRLQARRQHTRKK
ncbi:P121C protein, partial [Columbina picui]|nr:P121C protein [Columbina picui]